MPMATLEKHVGEMSEEETEECLTNPKTRIIHQVTIEDTTKARVLFDQLMGDTVAARKQFLKSHSEESDFYI